MFGEPGVKPVSGAPMTGGRPGSGQVSLGIIAAVGAVAIRVRG
jgi:hypothetical protein